MCLCMAVSEPPLRVSFNRYIASVSGSFLPPAQTDRDGSNEAPQFKLTMEQLARKLKSESPYFLHVCLSNHPFSVLSETCHAMAIIFLLDEYHIRHELQQIQ